EVNMNTWRAYAILSIKREADLVGIAFNPTTIAKGNKVFLLVGRGEEKYDNNTKDWKLSDPDIQLVVGEATQFKEGEQSGKINWSGPVSLLKQITDGSQSDAKVFYPGGGTGVLMEDGTLVLPVQGTKDRTELIPMIIYSTDDGNSWDVSKGTPPAKCLNFRITEWEKGQILMVLQCENAQWVFESRDMGRNWIEALGTLSGVWVNPHSNITLVEILRIGALITATIEERRVMLYVQKKFPSEENANALYLWITDNNR
ncbi:trans-sialidase, putative, partial [Trypanosoma cruzi marinkellei]